VYSPFRPRHSARTPERLIDIGSVSIGSRPDRVRRVTAAALVRSDAVGPSTIPPETTADDHRAALHPVPLSPSGEAGKEWSVANDRRGEHAGASPPARELLSAADVARIIARIAHQIIEKSAESGPPVLVGIPTRGAPLARRLAAAIVEFSGTAPEVGTVDPTLYRDDLRRKPARALEPTSMPESGVDDRLVILVDDVLYSGRTIRAALDALRDHGRPRAVQLAVLVDRGHRELPIRADYVGKNVPTARSEQILVLLEEIDGRDGVLIERRDQGS
jgi:pyrimidine operon attenuation protein/uracil phosphoribosyltransferase